MSTSRITTKILLVGLVTQLMLSACTTTPRMAIQPTEWRIRLSWNTESETNAFGFYVYRYDTPAGEPTILNKDNPLDAAGTTTTPQHYVFYDLDVEEGSTYYYKLEQVDLNGSKHWVIGDSEPIAGTAKALTENESQEIDNQGSMFREESG